MVYGVTYVLAATSRCVCWCNGNVIYRTYWLTCQTKTNTGGSVVWRGSSLLSAIIRSTPTGRNHYCRRVLHELSAGVLLGPTNWQIVRRNNHVGKFRVRRPSPLKQLANLSEFSFLHSPFKLWASCSAVCDCFFSRRL